MSASKGPTKTSGKSASSGQTKVLRIGIIHGGKIIEERRLKKRETVSIGTAQKSTFNVSSTSVPKHMDVFELVGGKYTVRFDEKMDGRVQTGKTSVRSFKDLRADKTTAKKGEFYTVPISDESRGKVIFEDVTMLFQFVDPPAAPGRVELPADIRGGIISTLDLQFSSILVVVALLCVSVVGYASNQPYVEPTSIEQISERYQKLIMPDRLPEPPRPTDVDDKAGEDKKEEAAKKEEPKKAAKPKKGKPSKGNGEDKPKVSAEAAAKARKEAITKQVAGKGLLGVIGVRGKEEAGALADVFADGGGVENELGNAFSGIQGVDIAENGGAVGTRGGGSGEATTIGDIGTEGGGSVETGKKTEAQVKGTVQSEAPEVDGELSVAKVKSAMRKYISGVKDCYDRALKRNPKLAGKIVIGFEILETGKVAEFAFPTDNVGSSEVRSCIQSRSRTWRFPKPDGGAVYVEFPLLFEPSNS